MEGKINSALAEVPDFVKPDLNEQQGNEWILDVWIDGLIARKPLGGSATCDLARGSVWAAAAARALVAPLAFTGDLAQLRK